MRILSQDRESITEPSKEIWIAKWDAEDNYMIVNNGYKNIYFGLYGSKERAQEVLAELCKGINDGLPTFTMPEK